MNGKYKMGQQKLENGDVYKGEFDEEGKFHGKGFLTLHNGQTYEGDFVHGKRQGNGIERGP